MMRREELVLRLAAAAEFGLEANLAYYSGAHIIDEATWADVAMAASVIQQQQAEFLASVKTWAASYGQLRAKYSDARERIRELEAELAGKGEA